MKREFKRVTWAELNEQQKAEISETMKKAGVKDSEDKNLFGYSVFTDNGQMRGFTDYA